MSDLFFDPLLLFTSSGWGGKTADCRSAKFRAVRASLLCSKESTTKRDLALRASSPPFHAMTHWGGKPVLRLATRKQAGQAILEYAILLAAILMLVFGTVRLVGTHARTVFSNAATSLTGSD